MSEQSKMTMTDRRPPSLSHIDDGNISLDLETTGVDPHQCSIVQIGIVGPGWNLATLVNPGVGIPPEATVVHGITDDMVRDAPAFAEIAEWVHALLVGRRVVTFNGRRYDLPILLRHLEVAGFPSPTVKVLDLMEVYRHFHKGDLMSVHRAYTGLDFVGHHSALQDASACVSLLHAMRIRHGMTDEELYRASAPENIDRWIDPLGKLALDDEGKVCFTFGKHKGKRLVDVPEDYLSWVQKKSNHSALIKKYCRKAVQVKRENYRARETSG